VRVLSLVHGEQVRSSLFGDVARGRGHALDEWSTAWETPPPLSPEEYDAVLVFGGRMHADQEEQHPWLREEDTLLRGLLEAGKPIFGVCLGSQLLAKAAGAQVMRAREPELGWTPVELTPAAAADPIFSGLPRRFDAFEAHEYTYDLPAGARELAFSRACTQAFRLGDRAWGVQFHPEVTQPQIERWLTDRDGVADADRILVETRQRIASWNELGAALCAGFLEEADRARVGGRP
jgi:GMP synthase (glutamine-hydrolysing)